VNDERTVVSTLAGGVKSFTRTGGYVDAPGESARFESPYGVAVDASGNVFVADQNNHRIRKVTASGGTRSAQSFCALAVRTTMLALNVEASA
jgi:hypothetical protein